MSAIKKFFDKKKKDVKFKAAGPGHRLDESPQQSAPLQRVERERAHPCSEAQMAGAAALARFDKKPEPVNR